MSKHSSVNMLKLLGLSALTCLSACKQSSSKSSLSYEEWKQARKEHRENLAALKAAAVAGPKGIVLRHLNAEAIPELQPQLVLLKNLPRLTASSPVIEEAMPNVAATEPSPVLEEARPNPTATEPSPVLEKVSPNLAITEPSPVLEEALPNVVATAPSPVLEETLPSLAAAEPSPILEEPKIDVESTTEIAILEEIELLAMDIDEASLIKIDDAFVASSDKKTKKKQKTQEQPIYLPSARGCKLVNGPTLMTEFLYWQIFEDQLTVAINESTTSFKTIQVQPNFAPGFRLGFGYNLAYDDWDVKAIWAWYHSAKLLHRNNGLYNVVIDGNGFGFGGILASNFSSNWKFSYDVLDLELGRNFYISKYVSMRPFASIRAGYIVQKLKTTAAGTYTLDSGAVVPGSANLTERLSFWAVGPRFGVNSDWSFGKSGFSLFFDGSGSLLYTGYDNKFKQFDTVGGTPMNVIFTTDFTRVRANLELFAGFDYGHCFWKWFDFHVYAGYMLNYWWNLNEFISGATFFPNGDLGLQGLNVGFEFEF